MKLLIMGLAAAVIGAPAPSDLKRPSDDQYATLAACAGHLEGMLSAFQRLAKKADGAELETLAADEALVRARGERLAIVVRAVQEQGKREKRRFKDGQAYKSREFGAWMSEKLKPSFETLPSYMTERLQVFDGSCAVIMEDLYPGSTEGVVPADKLGVKPPA